MEKIKIDDIQTGDIIGVSKHINAAAWWRNFFGTWLSWKIQRCLAKTPIGNPHKVNHTATAWRDPKTGQLWIYEIDYNLLRRTRAEDWFDVDHYDYYISRVPGCVFDEEKAWQYKQELDAIMKSDATKYDNRLIVKIRLHLKDLDKIGKTPHDDFYICSEIPQILYEKIFDITLADHTMLPNEWVRERIEGTVKPTDPDLNSVTY